MGLLESYFVTLLLTVAAAVLIAVSFGTDRWFDYTIDRIAIKAATADTKINKSPIYFTRYRGLFRICIADGTDADFLVESPYKEIATGGVCYYEQGYELTPMESSINLGSSYEIRKHVMRLQVAALAVSLFCTIVIAGLLMYSTLLKRKKYENIKLIVGLAAVVFSAGAMGCCHGIMYLENNKIAGADYPTDWQTDPLLKGNFKMSLGYSYIIVWVAVGLLAVAELLMLNTACIKEKPEKNRKEWAMDATHTIAPSVMAPTMLPNTMYTGSGYEYPAYGSHHLVPYIEGMPTRGSQIGLIPNESLYYR